MLDDQVEALRFIEPSHGLTGKQRWLIGDKDLADKRKCEVSNPVVLQFFSSSWSNRDAKEEMLTV